MQTVELPTRQPVPLRSNRNFQLLWTGSAAALLGLFVAEIAFPLVILSLTGSPGLTSLFAAVQTGAAVLLGIPAGRLLDAKDRRAILIAAELAAADFLAALGVDLDRAAQWSDAAMRWCDGLWEGRMYPGLCRVYSVELSCLRGDWGTAAADARRACDELDAHDPRYAGAPQAYAADKQAAETLAASFAAAARVQPFGLPIFVKRRSGSASCPVLFRIIVGRHSSHIWPIFTGLWRLTAWGVVWLVCHEFSPQAEELMSRA